MDMGAFTLVIRRGFRCLIRTGDTTILELKGVAFGMVFNDKNELFVIARDRVIKYSVPAP